MLVYYWILAILFTLSACGRTLDKQVSNQVRNLDQASFGEEEVVVRNIRQTRDSAVAEIQVSTAVKMKREQGKWLIEEIRIADRRWEKVEHILAVLKQERTATTRQHMDQISSGIRGYRERRGRLPQVYTFTDLIDVLSPAYLEPVIRIDAWSNPFFYRPLGTDGYDLRSAGPDGRLQTADDLVAEVR